MEDLGMSVSEISDVFRVVAAVLKLGNLCFVTTTNMDGTEGCIISNDYGETKDVFNNRRKRKLFRFYLICG